MTKNKTFLKMIYFLNIFILLFIAANNFFQPKWVEWHNYATFHDFYHEPENTIETIFLGSSTFISGINPLKIYDQYGISSYNLSTQTQPLLASYYLLQEVYRLHKNSLTTVVLEVSELRQEIDNAYYIKALTSLKQSIIKLRALGDFSQDIKSFISYNAPIFSYHDRWMSLEKSDWEVAETDKSRGFYTMNYDAFSLWSIEDIHYSQTIIDPDCSAKTLNSSAVKYFEKIVTFCSEHMLTLILIKTPASYAIWDTSLHNATSDLALKSGLDFYDLNFIPLSEELEIHFPLEMYDNGHLNYNGAEKLSVWVGNILAKSYGNHDVRGLHGFEFLDAQSKNYQNKYGLSFQLANDRDIGNYVFRALNNDLPVMVFISLQDDGSASLTEKQREKFTKLGLIQIKDLDFRDSYLAVLTKDQVYVEKLKKASPEEPVTEIKENAALIGIPEEEPEEKFLSFTGVTDEGVEYDVRSGGFNDGNLSSILINGIEYSMKKRGINIVVYNWKENKIIDQASFDTYASSLRPASLEERVRDAEETGISIFEMDEDVRQVHLYDRRYDNYKITTWQKYYGIENDLISFLQPYKDRSEYVIYLSVRDEASNQLDEDSRRAIEAFGLPVFAGIGNKDSYIGIIDDGSTTYEQVDHGFVPITYESYGLSLKSGGWDSGNTSSIWINGTEFSPNSRGLNVVVYDKELETVVTKQVFDFFAEKMILQ